jgi:beta propeller repeat protein
MKGTTFRWILSFSILIFCQTGITDRGFAEAIKVHESIQVGGNYEGKIFLDISGNRIVWSDESSGRFQAKMYDFLKDNVTDLSSYSVDATEVHISNEKIIWSSWVGSEGNITYLNADTSESFNLNNTPLNANQNDISGDRAVYRLPFGIYEMYDFDPLNPNPRTSFESQLGCTNNVSLSGNYMVCSDNSNPADIILYNLDSHTEIKITDDSYWQSKPAMSGSIIVWTDFRHGDAEIYMFDLTTMTETRVTDDPADQYLPKIDRGKIVWSDLRNGKEDVYMYNIATQHEEPLSSYPSRKRNPNISGDKIVWFDDRNGLWELFILSTGLTPTGDNIEVNPEDTTSGGTPINVTFSTITETGTTTVTTYEAGSPPPSGFKVGSPPTYFDVSTTADYSGTITVCFDYSAISFNNPDNINLFHKTEGGSWVDVTSFHDKLEKVICGEVGDLSLFVAAEKDDVLNVSIDIKPGSEPNCINNNGHGVIPVAILGTADFDVLDLDPGTVSLSGLSVKAVGKNNKLLTHYEDVNSDGFMDLTAQIEDQDGVFTEGVSEAILTGVLWDGTPVEGADTLCIVP